MLSVDVLLVCHVLDMRRFNTENALIATNDELCVWHFSANEHVIHLRHDSPRQVVGLCL